VPVIPDAEKVAKLRALKDKMITDVDLLAENLYRGRITLGMWEEDMRTRLRIFMAAATMVGHGDPTTVTQSIWGRVGNHLRQQYRWLHGFAKAIYENKSTVSLAAIKARAHLYIEAANKIATDVQAEGFREHLPYLPADGSTTCLNRCGCQWVLEVVSEQPDQGAKTVKATWKLHPEKEHCEARDDLAGCVDRDGVIVTFEVPSKQAVPPFIGLGG